MCHPDLSGVEQVLRDAVPAIAPAAQLAIRWRGEPALSRCDGWLDPEQRARPAQLSTLFDLASVTKLFVVTAFMRLAEAGRVGVDQRVAEILPEFGGPRPIRPYEHPLAPGELIAVSDSAEPVDSSATTFRQLLTHTSGLPAWRPLFRQPGRDAARRLAVETAFAYPAGARVVYSDIGLILLGMAIERIVGAPLDAAVDALVTAPLGLAHTRFLPLGGLAPPDVAPTERCAWRGRRVLAEVHDENAAMLGGVSGHAGLFATAEDVAMFGQLFLGGGRPLLSERSVGEMTRLQAEQGDVRRGLGFALWSPDPEASGNPFSRSAYGHTGFTGTSLWVDPERDLVVALLTNDVYHGREGRGIAALRVSLHRAVVAAVDAARPPR